MDLRTRIGELRGIVAERGKVLNPPLPIADVEAFEHRVGIQLPADYRAFVTEVGNGGGGRPPFYGLLPLAEAPDDHHLSATEILNRAAKPFPLTSAWIWENEESPDQDVIDQVDNGVIHLGTDGCGMYWVLVVTGSARGTVWLLTGEGATPCSPPMDFVDWYGKGLLLRGDWPGDILG